MTTLTRRKAGVLLAILLVASFVAMAALAEGAVRLRQYLRFGSASILDRAWVTDERLGLRVLVPNTQIGPVRINGLGFRGPDIPVVKPEETARIAFLGASTTYCAEVGGNDMTWPHLVTATLRERFEGAAFDYVNAGVPGYTVADSLKNLTARIAPLSPDVIVIYHATNDFSSDVRALARAKGFEVERPDSDGWLSRQSMLWHLVVKNVQVMARQSRAASAERELFAFDAVALSRGFETRLEALVRNSQSVAPLVALATFAPRLRDGLDPRQREAAAVTAAYYMPHISIDGMIAGYKAYNDAIRRVARRTGALLIEAAEAIPPDAVHYNDSVHFLDLGSREMANTVSEALINSPALHAIMIRRATADGGAFGASLAEPESLNR